MQTETGQKLSIRVAGVGGAGVKIAAALCAAGCGGADIAAVDTDEASLRDCPVENAACVGKTATGGMGSGGDPATAKEAAISDLAALKRIASGADVFICVAGLGGGTGSGARRLTGATASGERRGGHDRGSAGEDGTTGDGVRKQRHDKLLRIETGITEWKTCDGQSCAQ